MTYQWLPLTSSPRFSEQSLGYNITILPPSSLLLGLFISTPRNTQFKNSFIKLSPLFVFLFFREWLKYFMFFKSICRLKNTFCLIKKYVPVFNVPFKQFKHLTMFERSEIFPTDDYKFYWILISLCERQSVFYFKFIILLTNKNTVVILIVILWTKI